MTYSFNDIVERRNTRAAKWDLVKSLYGSDEVLPMWVADMDFKVPEAVSTALVERARHGIFGYTLTDAKISDSIVNWLSNRHQWKVPTSNILYSPGVITTLYMAIQTFTKKQDKVLIQTPVYPPFYDIVKKHDRTLVKNKLILEDGKYNIDFEDFENQLKNGVTAFILCNPHNPVGRVWSKVELEKMVALCKKYDVLILSDEIHADITLPPHKHHPIATIDEEMKDNVITCLSPTKTFNLAGLQVSYVIVSDKEKRVALEETFHKQGIHIMNTMGITALEAAYNDGAGWVDGLMEQLSVNINYVEEVFASEDKVDVIRPEGTYLIWLDFRKLSLTHEELKNFLQKEAKVGLNDGMSFGEEGEGFMRMNVACPLELVKEGANRIKQALHLL